MVRIVITDNLGRWTMTTRKFRCHPQCVRPEAGVELCKFVANVQPLSDSNRRCSLPKRGTSQVANSIFVLLSRSSSRMSDPLKW